MTLVDRLKNLIAEQIPIIEVALNVHRVKVSSDLLPLHERLDECFTKMQMHVESKYGKRTTDLKFEKDPAVTFRQKILGNPLSANDNRHSETSMGSSE